jgi:hypothetical protein
MSASTELVEEPPFDLRALIREVCETCAAPDPVGVAKEVGARIEAGDQRDALDQALPTVVQHVISRSRGPLTCPGGQNSVDAHGGGAAGAPTSRKVAAIRNIDWRKQLEARVSVGPNDWKFFGDFTAADLDAGARLREDHARRNTAAALNLRRWVELLARHRVDTIRRLPEAVLRDNLGAPE